MKTSFYQPFFKYCLLLLLAFFSFFQNGNAATERWINQIPIEKKVNRKKVLKLKNKVKKKIEKRRKKRSKKWSDYDDFDYNILLLISLGFLGLTILFIFFIPQIAWLFLIISGLLSMICISNDAHFVAWLVLAACALLFFPVTILAILSGRLED